MGSAGVKVTQEMTLLLGIQGLGSGGRTETKDGSGERGWGHVKKMPLEGKGRPRSAV